MGVLGQTALLFFKNILLRVRHPGLFGLEVLWPVLVIGIVAIMRVGVPPVKKPTCHYQPRAMPSAGVVPFMQTYVCNLDNRCFTNEKHLDVAEEASYSFNTLADELGPYLSDQAVLDVLAVSNKSASVIYSINGIVSDKELIDGLEKATYISNYFKDPDRVKQILETDFGFSPNASTALMESQIDVGQLMNLTGNPDIRGAICDPSILGTYVKFPYPTNVTDVSAALCGVKDVESFANVLISQLNVTELLNAMRIFERIKTNIGVESWEFIFQTAAQFLELVFDSESILQTIGKISAIPDITDIIRNIPQWIRGFEDITKGIMSLKDIVASFEPLMTNLGLVDNPWWLAVNNAVHLGTNFALLTNEMWNGTAEEFAQPLKELMQNIRDIAQSASGQQAIVVFRFLSQINWPDVYNQFIYTRTLNEATMVQILNSFQQMMESLPNFGMTFQVMRIIDHSMDVLTIFTQKSIDLRTALKHMANGQNSTQVMINKLFMYGPSVTKVILEAFLDPQLLGRLMVSGTDYGSVCKEVMSSVEKDLPPDVYTGVHDILCVGSLEEEMTALTNSLNLREVSNLVNSTVQEILHLYDGNFYGKNVSFVSMYYKYTNFTVVFNDYVYGDKWMDIFNQISMGAIDTNPRGWEPVTDMLTTDFLTTGVLSMYRGLGSALVGTRVSDTLAPYVHMMSRMLKIMYDQMNMMAGGGSPQPNTIMQALSMVSTYMPEIVTYMIDMWDNHMDAVYALADSPDPLATFCQNKYLEMSSWPAHVPLSDMSQMVCGTNWSSVVVELMQPAGQYQTMVDEITRLFDTTKQPATYDIELDWIDMMDYMQRVIDLASNGDFLNADLTMGYQTAAMSLNFTNMAKGVDILFKELETMSWGDVNKTLGLAFRVMESLDRTQHSWAWSRAKRVFWVVEAWLDTTINITSHWQNGGSLKDILKSFSPDFIHMNALLAKAYPEAVRAMAEILTAPEKLLDMMLRDGLPNPDCKTTFVADYLLLPPTSAVHDLERFMCGLNYETFFMEMSQYTNPIYFLMEPVEAVKAVLCDPAKHDKIMNPAVAYTFNVTELSLILCGGPGQSSMANHSMPVLDMSTYSQLLNGAGSKGIDPVNWRGMADKVLQYLKIIEAPMMDFATFDLTPYNMSAIQLSWEEFYRAADTLQNFDMAKIEPLSIRLQELSMKVFGVNDQLVYAINSYSYISYHAYKLLNTEMAFLNESTQTGMTLFDHLGVQKSPELAKIERLLVSSPDINAVGVATLQRLIMHPEQAKLNLDFGMLCRDLKEFTNVFVVDQSLYNPAAIQKAVCDLNINFTILLDDLVRNVPSVNAFVNALSKMENATMEEVRVDMDSMIHEYTRFSTLLEALIIRPPQIKITQDDKWTQDYLYAREWESFISRIEAFSKDLENATVFRKWESSLNYFAFKSLEDMLGPDNEIYGFLDAIFDIIKIQVEQQTGGGFEAMRKYPNLNKVIDLMFHAPEFVQTVMYTVLTQQQKTAQWAPALQSWEGFCATPTDMLFTVPPELSSFNMTGFVSQMCTINPDTLMAELQAYHGFEQLGIAYNSSQPVNATMLTQKVDTLIDSFMKLASGEMKEDPLVTKLFDPKQWETIGARIGTWYDQYLNFTMENLPEVLAASLGSSLSSLGEDFNLMFYQATAVSEVVMDQLILGSKSNNLNDAFKEYPTMQMFAGLLNELPEVLETLLYTTTYHPEKLTTNLAKVTSFESFCKLDALDLMTLAPNSTWDARNWMARLCTFNVDNFLKELGNSPAGLSIAHIMNTTKAQPVDMASLVAKAESIMQLIEKGPGLQDRIFDPQAWDKALKNIEAWAWPYSSLEEGLMSLEPAVSRLVFTTMEAIPEVKDVFGIINAILDMIQKQIDQQSGNSLDSLRKYPNTNKIIELLVQAPELIQTVMYTVLTQQEKTQRWPPALQSWEGFCTTPTDILFSVPPELTSFNMTAFVSHMCTINPDMLLKELEDYQGMGQLEAILMNNSTNSSINAKVLTSKFDTIFQSIVNSGELPQDELFTKLFDPKEWETVGARVEKWSNQYVNFTMENLPAVLGTVLGGVFNAYADHDLKVMLNQVVGITEVMMDEIIRGGYNSTSLVQALREYPSLQLLAGLLNELPELLETLLYTTTHHSDKLATSLTKVTSFESFCKLDAFDLMTLAPNSTWDARNWMARLCTFNVDTFLMEMRNSSAGLAIAATPYTTPDFFALVAKTEAVVHVLTGQLQLKDRVFATTTWVNFVNNINSWIWPYSSVTDFLVDFEKNRLLGFVRAINAIPGAEDIMGVIDAVLGMVGRQVVDLSGQYPNITQTYPTLSNFYTLMEQAPEMLETVVYTLLTQPHKTQAWTTAFQSFANFCSMPASSLMSVPPGSQFDLQGFVDKVCKINLEALFYENNAYTGMDKLLQALNETSGHHMNSTVFVKNFRDIIDGVTKLVNNPELMANQRGSRAWDVNVWRDVLLRIEQLVTVNLTQQISDMSATDTVVLVAQIVDSTLNQIPELSQAYRQSVAIADVLVDQVLEAIDATSVREVFKQVPSVQKLLNLVDLLPEVYETLLYSALAHPQKIITHSSALTDLYTFCTTPPEDIFTVAPGSNFNLTAAVMELCTLNITQLEEEVLDYKTSRDIANIINGTFPTKPDLLSVISKIDTLVQRVEGGDTVGDRFVDQTLWAQVNRRVEQWMADATFLNAALIVPETLYLLVNEMVTSDPSLKEPLRPVMMSGAILDQTLSLVLALENMTHFGTDELFANWEEMRQLFQLIQMEGTIEMLMDSSSNQKLIGLLSDPAMLADFCRPGTPATKYLSSPASTTVDLNKFQQGLCAFDYTLVAEQFYHYFNMERIVAVGNGSADMNWAHLQQTTERFTYLVEKWTKMPPTFDLPQRWMNETYWLNMLNNLMPQVDSTQAIEYQILNILQQLEPFAEADGIKQMVIVLNSVLDLVNENLVAMQGGQITLANAVVKIPALRHLFAGMGLDSQTLRALLFAPMTNTTLFVELLTSPDHQKEFCVDAKWDQLFSLPKDFDTTPLHAAICQDKADVLLQSLQREFNFTSMVDALTHGTDPKAQWASMMVKLELMLKNLDTAVKNPPTFQSDELLQALTDVYTNETNLWGMVAALQSLNTMGFDLGGDGTNATSAATGPLNAFLSAANAMVHYLNDMMARVQLQNGRLDLAGLFKGAPDFVNLMSGILDIQPDPITGVFSINIRPEKVNEFNAAIVDPTKLKQMFCDPATFHKFFSVANTVDVDSALTAFCTVDFNVVANQLRQSFMVDGLERNLTNAWNHPGKFDTAEFSKNIELMISKIEALVDADRLMFGQHDMSKLTSVNTTLLMENLFGEYTDLADQFSKDYLTATTTILSDVLNSMQGDPDIKSVIVTLRIIQNYLHNFNTYLKSLKDQPISLALLLNNTEVGNIINPILNDAHLLDGLLNAKLNVTEMANLINSPDPERSLCGNELWQAIQVPDNERQPIVDLRDRICAVNQTLLMWQTVMLRANGYQLMQQFASLSEELMKGQVSTNLTAVNGEITEFYNLMSAIVEQYMNGQRSVNDLLDLQGFQELMSQAERQVAQMLMDQAVTWSVDLSQILFPSTLSPEDQTTMAKVLNTMNVVMESIIQHLQAIQGQTLSLSSLLNGADGLINLVEAMIRVARDLGPAVINNELQLDQLKSLFLDMGSLYTECQGPMGVAQRLTRKSPPTGVAVDISDIVCALMNGTADQAVKEFVDDDAINKELTTLWESSVATPDYAKFAQNLQELAGLVETLSKQSLTVDPQLTNIFDFNDILGSFERIASDPQMIFRLLKLAGFIVDVSVDFPLELTRQLYSMNQLYYLPVLRVFEALKDNHLTLETIAANPDTLLDTLSTLLDFNVHYDVIREVLIESQMRALMRYRGSICNGTHLNNGTEQWYSQLNLGVPLDQLEHMLCVLDLDQWEGQLAKMNLTDTETVVLFQRLFNSRHIMDLRDYFDPDFGFVQVMSTLEQITALASEGQIDRTGIQDVRTAWEAVRDIFFDKSISSLLSYLQLAETMDNQYGLPSENWIGFRQFLSFFSTALDFLNKHMSQLGTGQVIHLQDILPNSDRVAALVREVFGPSNAAELLTTVINPEMFYRLSIQNAWKQMCQDPFTVSAVFQFPPGTDTDAVTSHLCQAINSRSSSFSELVSLFGAGDVLKQLDDLIHNNYNQTLLGDSVFSTFHASLMRLIHTAEGLQYAMVDGSSADAWLQPLMETLNSFQNPQTSQLVQTCEHVISYLNNTEGYREVLPGLSQSITVVNLMAELTVILPELDEIACILMGGESINLTGTVNKLNSMQVWSHLEKALSDLMSPPRELNCMSPLVLNRAIMNLLNWTMSGQGLDADSLTRCLGNTEQQFARLISDTSQALGLANEVLVLMRRPEISALFTDSAAMSVVYTIFDTIQGNQNYMVNLADLLHDPDLVLDHLTNIVGLSNDTMKAFINATVHSDWVYFLTKPVDAVKAVLCDPAKLDQILDLPANLPFNMTELSHFLCDANGTADVLTNASLAADDIAALMSNSSNTLAYSLEKLLEDILDTIHLFQDNFDILNDLIAGVTVQRLKDNLDKIAQLMTNDALMRLAQSVKDILKEIEKLVPEGLPKLIVQDIEKVVDGLLALDQIKDLMNQNLKVKDLINDPDYVRFYMKKELNFTDSLANSILEGTFTVALFKELDMAKHSCDEVINRIIITNSSSPASKDELRHALCSLNEKQYEELMNSLAPQLQIGDFISNYVVDMEQAFLGKSNVTRRELSDMVQTIDEGQAVLVKASDIISSSPNGSALVSLFSDAKSAASMSFEDLTPTLCGGRTVDIFDTGFNPGVLVTTTEDIEDEIDAGIKEEQQDLPNPFCEDVYQTIRKSGIGSILWAYIKPIMRGKILYTPDNPATRAIIQKANVMFETVKEIQRVATIWATESPNLLAMTEAAQEARELKDALSNDFISGLLQASTGMSTETLITSLDALEANNIESDQLKGLQVAADLIANYTSCIETDRYVPVNSENELINEAWKLSRRKIFLAGIVFENSDAPATNTSRRKRQTGEDQVPSHVTYKIRMDVDNTMDTNRLKTRVWKMDSEDNFVEDLRYMRGFIHIQDMLDTAIIDIHKHQIYKTPGFRIQQMPFPCHHDDNFVFLLGSYLIPIMMTFVFLAALGIATHNFVYDRENGQEQTLHVMGLISGLNFVVWLVTTMLLLAGVCIILAVMIKYLDIFIYSDMLIVWLFFLDFCLSSLMLAYMVSAFFSRTTMAILFVMMIYLMSYLPFILVISLEIEMEFWQKTIACLASTTAFSFGSMSMAHLEETGVGLQWDNIKEDVIKDFSMHWACIMMLIDAAIYFLVGWYVRGVKPGKYGVSQPWYFPVLPSYWSSCARANTNRESLEPVPTPTNTPHGELFEPPPQGYKVGIAVQNLSKVYCKSFCRKTTVVENLNLNFYEGQVTSLLGHNGAAKTTTINMITGVLEPTSGRVLINGEDPGCAKGTLGVCPQQNALFSYMTALQHMMFYAGMKGSDFMTADVKREIIKLLRDVDMYHNRHTPVGEMSYGMKRRLSVALAFVAGSKIIVLDEPTSGIDPNARKNIWTLISRNRHGRTILLSTHHLDEADILSDRIAIMHQGKLLCCGTPAFLKKSLGADFRLTVAKSEAVYDNATNHSDITQAQRSSTSSILQYVHTLSPTATLKEQKGLELTINLPKEESQLKVSFHEFFNSLERESDRLGIQSYGVSDTTLEEVFLELTLKADQDDDPGVVNPVMTHLDRTTALDIDEELTRPHAPDSNTNQRDKGERRSGCDLTMAQMAALFTKRFHHYRRNWRLLITCVVLPLIAFLIALGFSEVRPDENEMKPLVLDPSIYGKGIYNFYKDEYYDKRYTQMLTNLSVGVGTACMAENPWFQEDTECGPVGTWYNTSHPFEIAFCRNARQVYINMYDDFIVPEKKTATQQLLQNLDGNIVSSYLLNTFKEYKDKRFGGWSFQTSPDPTKKTVQPYTWFNTKGHHAMPSYFNGMSNVVLRAQLPNSAKPEDYGITAINQPIRFGRAALSVKNLQEDAADAGIAIMVVMAFSFIPGGFILYLINERVYKEKQLQNISGVGLLVYWIVAFIWDMFIYMIAVAIAVGLVAIFQTDSFYLKDNHGAFAVMLTLYGWSIIPMLYCVVRLFDKGSTAYLITFCANLFLALATIISLLVMQLFRYDENAAYDAYNICKYVYMVFPQYCLGQGLMDMVSSIFTYKLFERFDEERYQDPYSFDVAGYYMLAMGIEGFAFFILAIIIDVVSAPTVSLSKTSEPKELDMDDDVIREKERVSYNGSSDVLQVDNLSKVFRRGFKKLRAVDHISFGVPHGESFGLLGVNGAGKTTTFRMLTGDLKAAGGRAKLNGQDLKAGYKEFGQDVGYCPQEGGLDQYLTGEETLYFHAKLRGFSGPRVKELVDDLLDSLQLRPYAHRTVSRYSGGTKRKLALAVALLGEPSILYLDEPTTGMDPATRRLTWAAILKANNNGQSVVLTSHSMDECDALCSRIAIMVNGRIKCIGSPQHLKTKFGNGYIVVMHTVKGSRQDLAHTILTKFPGSIIKAKHNNRYEMCIPGTSSRVADIIHLFQVAEREGLIEYYSISQATLDSVFISFAQDQRDVLESPDISSSGSSTGQKSDTPTGSFSSSSSPSTLPPKKHLSNMSFTNPEFVHDEEQPPTESQAVPSGNYYSNLRLLLQQEQQQPPVSPDNVTVIEVPPKKNDTSSMSTKL